MPGETRALPDDEGRLDGRNGGDNRLKRNLAQIGNLDLS
jgi:hypothetical protein